MFLDHENKVMGQIIENLREQMDMLYLSMMIHLYSDNLRYLAFQNVGKICFYIYNVLILYLKKYGY